MALKLCLVINEQLLNINYGSNWLSFHGVSYQTIDTVTFNMKLHDGKSSYRSQKDHKLIYF